VVAQLQQKDSWRLGGHWFHEMRITKSTLHSQAFITEQIITRISTKHKFSLLSGANFILAATAETLQIITRPLTKHNSAP
jgi:hypothetical protein